MAAAVVVSQRAHALRHAPLPVIDVARDVIEAPAVRAVASEVDIGAGERRAAQSAHHRHLVRRVVDRGQTVHQVAYLLRPVEQTSPLYPIGDARG